MKPEHGTLVRLKNGVEDLINSVEIDVTAWSEPTGGTVILTVKIDGNFYDIRLSLVQAKALAKNLTTKK